MPNRNIPFHQYSLPIYYWVKIIFMRKLLTLIVFAACTAINTKAQGLPGKSGGTSETSANEGQRIDFSSDPELKSDIQDVANSVAYKLMRCCSSWGGNNVRGMVEWDECYFSKARNTYSIAMTASWTGSLSGNSYWIKGKLKLIYSVSSNGNVSDRRVWEKIADSGGFSPGCGKDCSVND